MNDLSSPINQNISNRKIEDPFSSETSIIPYISHLPVVISELEKYALDKRIDFEKLDFSKHEELEYFGANFALGIMESFGESIIKQIGIIGFVKQLPKLVELAVIVLSQFYLEVNHGDRP